MDYPVDVDDEEAIVRVVKTPFHFNKSGTTLKAAAFRPPRGSNETSVIRWQYAVPDGPALKAKVREIASGGGAAYRGVARLTAAACKVAGVDVRDSRSLFQGHADLLFPMMMPATDDPAEASDHAAIVTITNELQKAAMVLIDPNPDSDEWTIGALPPPPA